MSRDAALRPEAAELDALVAPVRFADPAIDRRFHRDGYVRVPFLDPPAVEELRALWDELGAGEVVGIWSNVHVLPLEVNRRIDATITRVFGPAARALFVDAYLAGASFLVKGTGPQSASTPHQDWNNVDETRAQSLSIWCPLIDVDEENGALQVVPGSHRLRPSIRSLDTPSLYLDFTDELEPYLRAVPARAGEAVLYAHNLFHGSKPNRSEQVRVAAVSGVLPDGARHLHYRRAPDGEPGAFDVLEIDRQFFLEGIPAMKQGQVPSMARQAERVVRPSPALDRSEAFAGFAQASPGGGPR